MDIGNGTMTYEKGSAPYFTPYNVSDMKPPIGVDDAVREFHNHLKTEMLRNKSGYYDVFGQVRNSKESTTDYMKENNT